MQTDMISFRHKELFDRTDMACCCDGLLSSGNRGVCLGCNVCFMYTGYLNGDLVWRLLSIMLFSGLLVSKNTNMVYFQTHSILPLGDVIFYVIYFVKPTCGLGQFTNT